MGEQQQQRSQLLQKLVGAVLARRLGRRPVTGPARVDDGFGLATPIDPGLDDMARAAIVANTAVKLRIFGKLRPPFGKVVVEEWTFTAIGDEMDQNLLRMAVRSVLVVMEALPILLADCNFVIECPEGTMPSSSSSSSSLDTLIPIDEPILNKALATSSISLEPFGTLEFPGRLGHVRYRCDLEPRAELSIAMTPPSQPSPSLLRPPHSFESVRNSLIQHGSEQREGDKETGVNDGNKDTLDTVELTCFLRRIESRPSLPGLYSDAWLADFGEPGGWDAVVRAWREHCTATEQSGGLSDVLL